MKRIIRTVKQDEFELSAEFVKKVFTESENKESGALVANLVREIRSKKYYLPELDLIMVDENDEIIGLALFSHFHIDGKYEDELLILSPVAVKTELQRQHVSKELIDFGLERAKSLGYSACIVEGNPRNYNARGFVTSAPHGIFAHESVGLPAPECLMVCELKEGALEHIKGGVEYSFYEALR